MRFAIIGAKKDTGADVKVAVEAPDEQAAAAIAARHGILVETIKPLPLPRAGGAATPAAPRSAPVEAAALPRRAAPVAAPPLDLAADEPLPLPAALPAPVAAAMPAPRSAPAPQRREHPVSQRKLLVPAIIAAAVIILGLGLWFGWGLLFGSSHADLVACLPDNSQAIVVADIDKLRQAEAWNDLAKPALGSLPADLAGMIDDVSAVAFAMTSPDAPEVVVIRFKKDKQLDEMLPGKGGVRGATSYNGCDISRCDEPLAWGARLNPRTFLMAKSQQAIQSAIDRGKKGSAPAMSDDMRRAKNAVDGHSVYAVVGAMSSEAKAVGFGLSIGSSIKLDVLAIAPSEQEAKSAVANFEKMKGQAGVVMMPPEAMKLLGNIKFSSSGADVRVSGSWDYKDVKSTAMSMLPELTMARERANRVKCAANMRQIGQSIMLYATENKGQYPPDLGTLVKKGTLRIDCFVCPTGSTSPPHGLEPDEAAKWVSQHADYVYLCKGGTTDWPPDTVLLHEKPSAHTGEGMNLLYADGHVEWQPMADAMRLINKPRPGKLPTRTGR